MEYKQTPVLPMLPEGEDTPTAVRSNTSIIATASGVRKVIDRTGTPRVERTFRVVADGKPAIRELRTFLDARRGRVHAFWCPSFSRDFILAQPAAAGAVTVVVKSGGYAEHVFPQGVSKRNVVRVGVDGSLFATEITNAVATGGEETLTLANGLPVAMAAGEHMSHLTYCRLDADETTVTYTTLELAEASITAIEIPKEAA